VLVVFGPLADPIFDQGDLGRREGSTARHTRATGGCCGFYFFHDVALGGISADNKGFGAACAFADGQGVERFGCFEANATGGSVAAVAACAAGIPDTLDVGCVTDGCSARIATLSCDACLACCAFVVACAAVVEIRL
jgi:hypothetical protein